ncbi:Uncharacterized protein FWK35_00034960, partial [Aphis craccivora]
GDVIRVIDTISHITQELEENSLSEHGLFIAQLHTCLKTVEEILTLTISSAIVDIQCVLGAGNKYMIKEMSVVDTGGWASQHWIFKNSNSKQDNKSRKTNKWLERNYHQLSTEYSDVEYEEVGRILNSLKFDCNYVKSEQQKTTSHGAYTARRCRQHRRLGLSSIGSNMRW